MEIQDMPDTEKNSAGNDLSQRVLDMPDAAIISMAQRARDIAALGHDVVNLTVGQPDFDTPDFIKQAAKHALDQGFTKYTPVPGLPELRQAIAEKFLNENNIDYTPEQIVVSNGAKQSIVNACLALLNPGDEVILTAPYWASYPGIIALAGAKPVICPAGIEEDFKVPAHRLEAAITEKTRILIINTPCNPTGAVHGHKELEAIAEVIARNERLYVICDEIYEYINFTRCHTSLASFAEAAARTITVNGFSKGFAMTGWRLGYMGAPQWLADACVKIQANTTSGAGSFAQHGALAALKSDRTHVDEMVQTYRARRDLMVEALTALPGVEISPPDGTFYVFPDISHYLGARGGKIETATDFCNFLLDDFHLACVPGGPFGDDNCIRISFAASRLLLDKGIDRMAKALDGLS